MIFPSIVDFVKKKFIPASSDTPERTMSTLATTKPETLAPYMDAMARYLDAQTKFFNRDISGNPSVWVVNLRACIRPFAVIASFFLIGLDYFNYFEVDPTTRAGLLLIISNWLGTKIVEV
jgi:hypothetical protein